MALSFTQMKNRVETVEVSWQGETFDVGYFPAAMTPNSIKAIQEQARAAKAEKAEDPTASGSLNSLAEMIEPLVAWWDILDDEGNRLPATADTIGDLPLALTMAVFKTVQEAITPPASRG